MFDEKFHLKLTLQASQHMGLAKYIGNYPAAAVEITVLIKIVK